MRPTRVLALAGLSVGILGTAQAEIESEFHVGYSTDYVFRGIKNGGFGEELYEFGFDFAGSTDALGGLGWSGGLWYATFEPTAVGTPKGKVNNQELDVYAEVSKSLNEMFSIAAGLTSYNYFGANAGTADDVEPYISLGADVMGISLGATAYHDSSNTLPHEWYYEVSAAYEHELTEGVSAGFEVVGGFFDTSLNGPTTGGPLFDVDKNYVAFTASLSIGVAEGVTVSPYISHSLAENDYTYGGVSVAFGF